MAPDRLAREVAEAGYSVVRRAWGRVELDEASARLAELEVPPNGVVALDLTHDPTARSFAADARILAIAEAATGGPVTAFGVTFMVKPPQSSLPVLWHQDGHPWGERLGIESALTVWVALEPSTIDSGCLWVVPGSHRLGARPLRAVTEPANVFGWASPADLIDEGAATPLELAPGDASVHHSAVVHRSGPNRTSRRRSALAIRFGPR